MQEKDIRKGESINKDIPQKGAEMQPNFEHESNKQERSRELNQPLDKEQAVQGIRSLLTRTKQKNTTIPTVRDSLTVEVEHIMEDGIRDAFIKLPPADREMFKIKGEETAYQIRELLKSTHVKVKKIFALLLEWLKLLPGVNRFFLEQEAKIKADKIVALKHRR